METQIPEIVTALRGIETQLGNIVFLLLWLVVTIGFIGMFKKMSN